MALETIVIIAILASPVLLAAVLVVAAHMRSSQMTRTEERKTGKLL